MVWTAEANIKGPQGPVGPKGDQGIPGPPGGLGEAPLDGRTYGRKDAAWARVAAGVTVSDTPPVGAEDNSLWWESDSGILYVRFNDGDSTQWVQAVALPAGGDLSMLVKKTGDTMSGALVLPGNAVSALQAVPKQQLDTVAATAMDMAAYSGMQINGSFDVSQEIGIGVGVTSTDLFACDGWRFGKGGTWAGSAGAYSGGVLGLRNMLVSGVSTAEPALGASSFGYVRQWIEGYRTARLAWGTASAMPITIGFWSGHVMPGVYTVCIQNSGNARSYNTTYNHAVANVWQYNVVTIPGDTAGTWLTTNGVGLVVLFTFACTSTYTASAANTWQSGNFIAAPGQVNAVAATTNFFRLAGVVVLPGTQAPSAAQSPLIMRPYDQELITCQRYYTKGIASAGGFTAVASPAFGAWVPFPVTMRATPTVVATGGTPANATGLTANNASVDGLRVYATPTVNTNWFWDYFTYTADIRL